MDNSAEQTERQQASDQPVSPARVTPVGGRTPSRRASVVLAVAMLTVGVAVGAAVGPSPATSLAGDGDIAQKIPALVAAVAARNAAGAQSQPAATSSTQPPPITPAATPAASAPSAAAPASAPSPEATRPSSKSQKKSSGSQKSGGASELPPITSVWLIALSGSSVNEAIANPTVAPYTTGELIPKATLLKEWSALSASAFAADAALLEHRAIVGGTPPVLHTIVQPACPEGPTSATCLPGTPAGIGAADAFLKATIASITNSTTFTEHGLIVVTYAAVADPATAELPAGSASATLATQPPAGVLLLSPFAKAGAKPSVAFDPSSPAQSLEKLLH
ncbi:MAG TPA: hypothetical protein VL988_10090 [Solirubrobacteraceae bacterium]|nr:hypothetical protein [Solirubrobacteraceae bacterium]